MRRIGIFAALGSKDDQLEHDYVLHLLAAYRPLIDRLVVVCTPQPGTPHYDAVAELADMIVDAEDPAVTNASGYKRGIQECGWDDIASYDELVLFDSSSFGPLFPAGEAFDVMDGKPCDAWSMTFSRPGQMGRFPGLGERDVVLHWSFLVLRRPVLENAAIRAIFDGLSSDAGPEQQTAQKAALTVALKQSDLRYETFVDSASFTSSEPRLLEQIRLLEQRCPIMNRNLFLIDPLTFEMEAIAGGDVFRKIKEAACYDAAHIWRFLIKRLPPREIYTNTESLSIFPLDDAREAQSDIPCGKVAVLAHIYYPDVFDRIMAVCQNIEVPYDLFISTASEASRLDLLEKLKSFPNVVADVRVVEENRGRDMSSLFITFREIMLSGKYDVALRLHSKRTPQMARHISESFMSHLTDSLAPTPGYVTRILRLFADEPQIGMIIPITVHLGFATLGHAWVNNRPAAEDVCRRLGINVPLDLHTPLAPYGTMFWFRPAAFRKLFKYQWRWDDFNAEPNHVDGGMAHVLERLMPYAVHAEGYRTHVVMNDRTAARNYAKLEYKYQLIASYFPSGDIRHQVKFAQTKLPLLAGLSDADLDN